MRSILLWLIGVPIPIILLLAFCTHHFERDRRHASSWSRVMRVAERWICIRHACDRVVAVVS